MQCNALEGNTTQCNARGGGGEQGRRIQNPRKKANQTFTKHHTRHIHKTRRRAGGFVVEYRRVDVQQLCLGSLCSYPHLASSAPRKFTPSCIMITIGDLAWCTKRSPVSSHNKSDHDHGRTHPEWKSWNPGVQEAARHGQQHTQELDVCVCVFVCLCVCVCVCVRQRQ